MPDEDLTGADTLKLVRYRIVFVKPDYEFVFLEKEDLVSYATTGSAWAALKLAEFISSLGTMRSSECRVNPEDCDAVYLPCTREADRPEHLRISECNYKYIQIVFEVIQRWRREPATATRQLG
jgi:hypothetical protein